MITFRPAAHASLQASAQEPPIVMTEDNTVAQIIRTVCDLLMQYELVNKVDSTGDLQVILKQNLMDLCNWVRLSLLYFSVSVAESRIILKVMIILYQFSNGGGGGGGLAHLANTLEPEAMNK